MVASAVNHVHVLVLSLSKGTRPKYNSSNYARTKEVYYT